MPYPEGFRTSSCLSLADSTTHSNGHWKYAILNPPFQAQSPQQQFVFHMEDVYGWTYFYFQQASTVSTISGYPAGFELYSYGSTHRVWPRSNGNYGSTTYISNPDGKYMKVLVDFATGAYSFLIADTLGGQWVQKASSTDSQLTSGTWYFTYRDYSGYSSNKYKLINGQGCQDMTSY